MLLTFIFEILEANVIYKLEQVEEKLPLQPGDSIHLDVVIMPEDSWKLYNNKDKIEPMLIMSYSCEEGVQGGYTREICWVTVIKVMPSLEFSNMELFEIERFVNNTALVVLNSKTQQNETQDNFNSLPVILYTICKILDDWTISTSNLSKDQKDFVQNRII